MPTVSNRFSPEDRRLASAALAKRQAGVEPTRAETAALKRIEAAREEELRREYAASIPKRHWVEWSGRQVKILLEQARRYGIPIAGATINLPDVVRWLHDFLAAKARVLAEPTGETAAERLLRLKADQREIALAQARGELLPADEVRRRIARLVNEALSRLQQLPDRLASLPAAGPAEIRAAATAEIEAVSRILATLPDSDDAEEGA